MQEPKKISELMRDTKKRVAKWWRAFIKKMMFDRLLMRPHSIGDIVTYILVAGSLVAYLYIAFNIGETAFHATMTKRESAKMRREIAAHQRSIEADSILIEHLKTDRGLEQYAREKHKMTRENETIFRLK